MSRHVVHMFKMYSLLKDVSAWLVHCDAHRTARAADPKQQFVLTQTRRNAGGVLFIWIEKGVLGEGTFSKPRAFESWQGAAALKSSC